MTDPRDSDLIRPDSVPAQKRNPRPARWSLVLGTAITAILIGALMVGTSPGELVPEAILMRTDGSLGTFTATGDAVDSGRVCDSGVFLDQRPSPGLGSQLPDGLTLEVEFICGDEGTDFRIRGDVVESDDRFTRTEGIWRFVASRNGDAPFEGAGRFFGDKENLNNETLKVTFIGKVKLSP